jgi:hypothetical protein
MATDTDVIAGIVDLCLQTLHDGDGSEVPATAEGIARFARAADERCRGELITVDDVRRGLVRLRETRQVLAIAGENNETRYVLRRAVAARKAGG